MRVRDKGLGRAICGIERADDAGPAPPGPPQFADSPLPAAMLAVAHDDSPESRRILYESMFKTWFLVPTREQPAEKPGFHDVQTKIAPSFSLEHDANGVVVAVAFTDEEALRNWNKSIPWIAVQGTSFFQAVLNTQAEEIVINPYELDDPASKMIRPGGRVTRWEFESLAQGVVPRPQPDDDTDTQSAGSHSVLVSMPKRMPSAAMFSALAGAAGAFPEVVAMYFAQVGYPDGQSKCTVAVEFAPDVSRQQIEAAMSALVQEARKVFSRREPADFLLASSHLGQSIATTGEKFYSAAK
jgi:SseB protein N-terminal domain/SseB protein C-terminal domain